MGIQLVSYFVLIHLEQYRKKNPFGVVFQEWMSWTERYVYC